MACLNIDSGRKQHRSPIVRKTHTMLVGSEESSSLLSEDPFSEEEHASGDSPEQLLAKPLSNYELHDKEDALLNFESELAVMELEFQQTKSSHALKTGAFTKFFMQKKEYFDKFGNDALLRLEFHCVTLKRIGLCMYLKTESKEVGLFWCGMAESVQVMGSFDGWSQGEHLSPEFTGSFTKFSTTLLLRPGR
ncbi:hypothetical protein V6N12_027419 [Hibiscus sabdariffa]|uniref:AMP-activated protein kinase glycogen-binding domain-containing protein n=1 Tax=Hibiscus sabdariffa TaxID=183260 RepID=A0ABR2DUQ7_9ROSI